MQLPAKRSDALAAGCKKYCTGKSCKHGHIAPRNTATARCTECLRLKTIEQKDQKRSYDRDHYVSNREAYIEKAAQWVADNKAARAVIRSRNKAKRRHAMDHPINDIEKLMIQYRYEDAQHLTEETGIKHHVDHVWPLSKGGPHLPWNLRVITATENLQKSNKI